MFKTLLPSENTNCTRNGVFRSKQDADTDTRAGTWVCCSMINMFANCSKIRELDVKRHNSDESVETSEQYAK